MKIMFCKIMIMILLGVTANAQVNYKPASSGFLIGESKYTPLIFGNNKFRMEHSGKFFKIYIPSPNPNSGEYTFAINDNGYIGIGKQPYYDVKLDVAGNIACGGTYICYVTDRPYSIRTAIENPYNMILSLSGKSYIKNTNSLTNNTSLLAIEERYEYGFIAQEMEKVMPSLVFTGENGYKSVDYLGVVPVLVEAVKEQKKLINSQSERIDEVLNELNKLDKTKSCKLKIDNLDNCVNFKYHLNSEVVNSSINLYTINGVLVKQINLKSDSGIELIYKHEIPSGIYFYNFICDDIKVYSGSLSI